MRIVRRSQSPRRWPAIAVSCAKSVAGRNCSRFRSAGETALNSRERYTWHTVVGDGVDSQPETARKRRNETGMDCLVACSWALSA